jgi:hypothetical protein
MRRPAMTADYNGWADRPEEEREAEEAAASEYLDVLVGQVASEYVVTAHSSPVPSHSSEHS